MNVGKNRMKSQIEKRQINVSPQYDQEKFKRYVNLAYREGSTTARMYSWAFKKFSPSLTTKGQLDRFVATYLRGSKRNPFYSGFFKAFLDCFEVEYKFPKDLSRAKNYERVKEHKFLHITLIKRIINGTSPYISMMCRIYFDTGLRLRELMNIERSGINLDERRLRGIGKNGKPFNEKISSNTAEILERFMHSRGECKYPFHVRDCEDHAKSFWYFLKKECSALGIENVTPHRLRHSLGRHLKVDRGFDLDKVRIKLRHSKLDTTKIYAVSTKEEVDAEIDEKVFNEGEEL